MIRTGWWLVPVLILGLVVGGAIGAYVTEHDRGERVVQITTPGSGQAGEPMQVVRIDDGERWHGFGFFPFDFLLFPPLWIGLIWLVFGAFWRRGGSGRGRWDGRFEEWHRRQHENETPGTGGSGTASA